MKISINYVLLLFFAILCSACTPPGYSVILKTDRQDQTIMQIRQALIANGFEEVEISRSHGLIDRYKKRLEGVKRTFSNRNAEYWIMVDIWQRQHQNNFEVNIYNVYVGNSPEVKPILNEIANSIENILRNSVPNINILRSEKIIPMSII